MRVILDTNIFLSSLISPHGIPAQICEAWRNARFELITSDIQLEELRRASRYSKFKVIVPPYLMGILINNLQNTQVLTQLKIEIEATDPNDSFLIAMAQVSEADYLITGDLKAGILSRLHLGRTRVMTPAEFDRLHLD